MLTAVRNYLEAEVTGTGPVAAFRALHNLYGMTGTEIAFAVGRDRTMVSLYASGRKDVPTEVSERLVQTLESCLQSARQVKTSSESEDALLEAIMERTEEIIDSL